MINIIISRDSCERPNDQVFCSYPEVNIAIGMDIKAQMKIKNFTKGLKNENGKVWDIDTTIEIFALAKLIFDSALIFSYVFVNNAISILSNKVLTNMRNKMRRKFDIPCFQSFQYYFSDNLLLNFRKFSRGNIYFENYPARDKLIFQLLFPMTKHTLFYLVHHCERNWFLKWTILQIYEKILFHWQIWNHWYQLCIPYWSDFLENSGLVFHRWKFLIVLVKIEKRKFHQSKLF